MTYSTDHADLTALVRSGRVLVAGAGVSGAGAVKMLADLGCPEIYLVDDSEQRGTELATAHGIQWSDTNTAQELLADAAAVVTSPGWPPSAPLFAAAAAAGVPVVGDVAIAYAGDRSGVWGEPRTWLVVTGTNGKTTTTAMLAAMIGDRGSAVGNIGVALHDALSAPVWIEVLAAELSSFQLHWAPNLKPDAGVLLNLAEDHIDWHGSYQNYAEDKARALTGSIAVYGADDDDVVKHVACLRASGELGATVVGFTEKEPAAGDIGVVDGYIVDRAFSDGEKIAPIDGISPPGRAGVLDALAATSLARAIGVPASDIASALAGFTVNAHRGQEVHNARGVSWIDDSKATNPHAANAALSGHDSVVWVAGGQLKGADVGELVKKHAHRFRAVVALGVDAQIIADAVKAIDAAIPVTLISEKDPAVAMQQSCAAAAAAAHSGDVVLLAPAAASLDMYTGMAQRGDMFAQYARET